MSKLVKMKLSGIKRLELIKKEIISSGSSTRCPNWKKHTYKVDVKKCSTIDRNPKLDEYDNDSCAVCKFLFPMFNGYVKCPCIVSYQSNYLIKRLNEIINFSKNKK